LIGLISAVLVRAFASTAYVLRWIPTGIATIDQLGDFITVPWTVLCGERNAIARTKIYALYVSVPIGVDSLVETFRRAVIRVCVTITIDSENFAAQ